MILHLFSLVYVVLIDALKPTIKMQESIPVELVLSSDILDAMDSFQETADEAPEDPTFASDRNLKADEETSPEHSPQNLPKPGGARGKPPQKKEVKKQEEGPGEVNQKVFSLSKADIINETTNQNVFEGIPSPGFAKRLKKGEQLKLNARQFDYGNYLLRMKRKLIQRWNPQKTIVAGMHRFNEVRVDIAVVLDEEGKILETYILNKSLFPAYNREAISAFKNAAPFPNPPDSLIQDDGRIYMPWSFVLNLSSWGVRTIR